MPHLRAAACALAFALAALAATPATAEHPQAANARTVTFDHKTGNEWWVEVVLGGQDAASASKVESMDTGGSWVPLTKRSWGAWAASYHIEPGHQVRFRATWTTTVIESCWFTHPTGTEQCSAPPPGFDASFSGVKGNEWWVEARVTAGEPVNAVHARLDCAGEWRPLALRSWGAWAASFHVPAGTKVDLRATSASGAWDFSGGYTWPQATPTQGCATAPVAFRATFQDARGNQHWQEVDVSANQPVAAVEMRIAHGPWRPMTKTSWGSYATSFDVGIGPVVEFRARNEAYAYDHDHRGYTWWPDGPDVHPADAAVAWDWAAGSQQHVVVNTHSTQRIAAHHYTHDGAWVAMQVNEDGEWAVGAQAVPEGASVRFRATFADGSTHHSGPVPWPPFPQPGSWLEYRGRSWGNETDGGKWVSDVHGQMVLDSHEWTVLCKATTATYDPVTRSWTNETRVSTERWTPDVSPVVADTSVAVGEHTMVLSSACAGSYSAQTVVRREPHALQRPDGSTLVVDSWFGNYQSASADYRAWWDARYGVVLEFRNVDTYSFGTFTHTGRLVATDAPLR